MIDYDRESGPVDIPGVPEDTKYLADKLDQIRQALQNIENATIRRETLNPSIIEILFFDGVAAATPFGRFASSTRFRVQGIIPFLSGTTSIMSLVIGTRRYRLRVNTANSAAYLPFPIVIDAGVDISGECATLQGAGNIGGFYIIGYPDE